jgi:integrase
VAVVWAGRPACPTCYERVLVSKGVCDGCGGLRRIDPRNLDGRSLCAACAGLEPMQVCGRCGDEDKLYEIDRCRRCVLRRRVDDLVRGPDGTIRPELVAVRDCLAEVDPVRAGLKWVLRPRNQEILTVLASGELALTHEGLDSFEVGRAASYFRQVLVAAGALPARDETLALLETWIAGVVADIADPVDRHVVETFATWRLLRRVRQRAGNRETRDVGSQQGWIRRAVEFLAFLHAHDTTLAGCTQAHVDLWLAGPPTRRQAPEFLRWAVRQRLASNVEIALRPSSMPVRPLDADRYPALIRRLLIDNDIGLGDRVAGLLVLLYGQSASDIVRLTVDHVERRGDTVLLRLGHDPCVLPKSVACLVMDLVDSNRRGHATVGAPSQHRWLFAGSHPGRHLGPERLQVRLNRIGISVRDARTVALLNLAVDVPVGVLADMLGIASTTASRWAYLARCGWADYAAGRLAATEGARC